MTSRSDPPSASRRLVAVGACALALMLAARMGTGAQEPARRPGPPPVRGEGLAAYGPPLAPTVTLNLFRISGSCTHIVSNRMDHSGTLVNLGPPLVTAMGPAQWIDDLRPVWVSCDHVWTGVSFNKVPCGSYLSSLYSADAAGIDDAVYSRITIRDPTDPECYASRMARGRR